jgi:DNA-binding CsgD family transcriptional regulator
MTLAICLLGTTLWLLGCDRRVEVDAGLYVPQSSDVPLAAGERGVSRILDSGIETVVVDRDHQVVWVMFEDTSVRILPFTPRPHKASALQAVALHLQGDDDQALSSLARALALAEPSGYVRTFVDEGSPMSWLLRQALLRDIEPTYASRLLAAMDEAASLPANAALVEPRTDREIDVLRLIMAGLSNQEISDTLFIAVSTVKSHVNHMYGKLGVEHRTQAVLKAQERRSSRLDVCGIGSCLGRVSTPKSTYQSISSWTTYVSLVSIVGSTVIRRLATRHF